MFAALVVALVSVAPPAPEPLVVKVEPVIEHRMLAVYRVEGQEPLKLRLIGTVFLLYDVWDLGWEWEPDPPGMSMVLPPEAEIECQWSSTVTKRMGTTLGVNAAISVVANQSVR